MATHDESTYTPAVLDRHAPTYVAGHRGLVGSAICRRLEGDGFTNLHVRTRANST